MPSHFCVIQYVPDALSEERVNIGVVAFGDGMVRVRFLQRWKRVRDFSAGSSDFLLEFADRMTEAAAKTQLQLDGLGGAPALDEARIRRMAGRWSHAIRLTPPRGSLDACDALLQTVARRFLREPDPTERVNRGHREAVAVARTAIQEALAEQLGPSGSDLLVTNLDVPGKLETQRFEVGLKNGAVREVTAAISFEGQTSKVRVELDGLLYKISDVRRVDQGLPIAIVALPPRNNRGAYERAEDMARKLKAEFVPEARVAAWATKLAKTVGKAALLHH